MEVQCEELKKNPLNLYIIEEVKNTGIAGKSMFYLSSFLSTVREYL